MSYGGDTLKQIWDNTQVKHQADFSGSKGIDIHREVTGESVVNLESTNERLGDAIDDILSNRSGDPSRAGLDSNNVFVYDQTNSIGTDVAPIEVNELLADVSSRKHDYGERGNLIFDFLDKLGESDEDFELLELFTDKEFFNEMFEDYGEEDSELDFKDFRKFDFKEFGEDLGFKLDFNEKNNTLKVAFANEDSGYEMKTSTKSKTKSRKVKKPNPNANSRATKKSNNSHRSKKAEQAEKPKRSEKASKSRIKDFEYQANTKDTSMAGVFSNIKDKPSEGVSKQGKEIFNLMKNLSQAENAQEIEVAELFVSEDSFKELVAEHGDGMKMDHEAFKEFDFSELEDDLGVEIEYEEEDGEAELSIEKAEPEMIEETVEEVVQEEVTEKVEVAASDKSDKKEED